MGFKIGDLLVGHLVSENTAEAEGHALLGFSPEAVHKKLMGEMGPTPGGKEHSYLCRLGAQNEI